MNSFPAEAPAELAEAAAIRKRLTLLKHFYDLYCRLEYKSPTQRSQLAADDAATGWLRTSHLLRSYLNLAADNVRALLAMLMVDDKLEVPMHAHYPLIRSVVEGAGMAKWVLSPDDHRDRVHRTLMARFSEEKQDEKLYAAQRTAIVLHNPAAEAEMRKADRDEARKHDQLIAEIRRCSDAQGFSWGTVCSGAPGMETILRRVGEAGRVPGEYAASVWKVLSGLSHPSASRSIRHAHLEELGESRNGVIPVRVTASLAQTHQGLLIAQGLFTDAVLLFQRRMLAPQRRA